MLRRLGTFMMAVADRMTAIKPTRTCGLDEHLRNNTSDPPIYGTTRRLA